jgi:hypothetical protein
MVRCEREARASNHGRRLRASGSCVFPAEDRIPARDGAQVRKGAGGKLSTELAIFGCIY